MARITVEDCLEKVTNRFALVVLGSERARQLGAGEPPTVPRNRDKPTLIALREIAAGTINPEMLEESLTRRMRRVDMDRGPDEDLDRDDDEFAVHMQNVTEFAAEDWDQSDAGSGSERGGIAEMSEPSDEELAEIAEEYSRDDGVP